MTDRQPNGENPVNSGEVSTHPASGEPGGMLEWRCHPVTRRPSVSIAVSVFVIVVAVAVSYSTDSRLFTVLALVIMLGSLAKFYFPTSYKLTDKTVAVKTTTTTITKEWSQYRSFYPDKNGVLLSPFAEPSRLENFRGIYLMFAENRDEVIAFVKAHIGTGSHADSSNEKKQA